MSKDAIIHIEDLSVSYGESLILSGINIDIPEDAITVILGTSGCGKTTLLKSIVGLINPEAASLRLLGREMLELDDREYKEVIKNTGVLFQNGALLNSVNIYDNVGIPLEQHTRLDRTLIRNIAASKLALVGLEHAGYKLPSELSGGMKKRAGLARALALDPKIMFCDEPSAGLDPVTSLKLDELILTLRRQLKMTFVIVTHELASIHRIADYIVFLDQGRCLFSGSRADALSSPIPELRGFFRSGEFISGPDEKKTPQKSGKKRSKKNNAQSLA